MPDANLTATSSSSRRCIRVAVPRPLHAIYDYHVPEEMALPKVGARLRVPFGPSQLVGICIENQVDDPVAKTRPVTELIDDDVAIAPDLLSLARWMSTYYHYPLGEVLATVLPSAARKGTALVAKPMEDEDIWQLDEIDFSNSRSTKQTAMVAWLRDASNQGRDVVRGKDILAAGFSRNILRVLQDKAVVQRAKPPANCLLQQPLTASADQLAAIDSINSAHAFAAFVLEGVTGSGKTEVYLQAMAPVLEREGQVLVLVPEIALTPQTLARFERRFGRTGMLHSALSEGQRMQTWLRCRSGELKILIGTRSAIFSPFDNLQLIIVDEEHDSSYKQQEGLRYSARDLAVKRAQDLGIALVLGSATPSLESLWNIQRGRYRRLRLPHRAGGASMPSFHLIDLRGQVLQAGLSNTLVRVVRSHLANDGQVLLYLNRRGFAPTLMCSACGWQSHCSQCDARLTLHRQPERLICHHCTIQMPVPNCCENCGQQSLFPLGIGTQRIEEGLEALFPGVPVLRIDRDTTRSARQLGERLEQIQQNKSCLLVGTQMLAKGHHFPGVTLVAVLNADAGLLSSDFRAPERTAQLITQVAGRAGRAERSGEVWIQTHQPDNPLLETLISQGYPSFAELELESRSSAGLPPIVPMALIRAEAPDGHLALKFLQDCKAFLQQQLMSTGSTHVSAPELMGPIPAPMSRIANRYRYQLAITAPTRARLHDLLNVLGQPKTPQALRWSIDVDPYDAL